jgi:rod shape-determining protein MreC
MLLTDPNHAIPVHVNRNGLRAIALGTGAPDVLDIPYLPNSADIEEGDLLTSSGLGGRFPRDYPVAIVTTVVKDPSKPYAVVKAKPTALLETSREVLLVWSQESPRNLTGEELKQTLSASDGIPAAADNSLNDPSDQDSADPSTANPSDAMGGSAP